MKRNPVDYLVVGFLVGGIAVWLLMFTSVNLNNVGLMQTLGLQYKNIPIKESNTLDAHFIEQMIPHHEDAITMSRLAQTKAKKAEVKKLAEAIIVSQGKEIEQMNTWYKTWFGRALPTDKAVMRQHGMMGESSTMHMGMMGNNTDVTTLETAENFDRAFIEHMIPHHQMAVMMASMLKTGSTRPEMKKLADDIIATQTKEIEEMRKWLNTWEK